MSDYLMVPVKYSVLNVTNKNERMIYIPVATTETPGIVRIGEGLTIDYYGLLSVDEDIRNTIEQVKNGDVISKGFYEYSENFKYPKDSFVFSKETKDFYVSLIDDNKSPLTDDTKWSAIGLRDLEASDITYLDGTVEDALIDLDLELKKKVDINRDDYYIDNNDTNGTGISYNPNRKSTAIGGASYAGVKIEGNKIIISSYSGPTGQTTGTTITITDGGARPVLNTNNGLVETNSPIAVLSDLNTKQDKTDNALTTNNKTVVGGINELNTKTIAKQDKKPDGQTDLINAQTGKLDNAYLPPIISGTSRKFAGTFGEDGVIVASAYASEVNGQLITEINLADCVGYEFGYTGENPFMFDDTQVNKNDLIVCNGEQEPNWTLYDNSDKVVSVNGQTGAVQIDIPQAGIEQLVGTQEKPINFATDMEVGKLYAIDGCVYHSGTFILENTNKGTFSLAFKTTTERVIIYNTMFSVVWSHDLYVTSYVNINEETGSIFNTSQDYKVSQFNGSSGNKYVSFYAPTTAGTAGQILQSNGRNQAPTWVTPNYATLDDVNNAINGVWEESY